jgi:hypothetical protein
MATRAATRPKGLRRFERWLVGLVFAVMAFALEKVVMRSVRNRGAEESEEATTMISKWGEVDVDL